MNDPYRKAEDMTDYQKVLKGTEGIFSDTGDKGCFFSADSIEKAVSVDRSA